MACEKGSTYLDKLCHKFYDETKGRGKKTDYVCRLCGGPLETYYCEERLYLVKCADCGTLALVKTVNPEVSASVTLARPTLTPPNERISAEDRLPELPDRKWCEVMVITAQKGDNKSRVMIYERAVVRGKQVERWKYRWDRIADITPDFWMPLPEPPESRPTEGEENGIKENE